MPSHFSLRQEVLHLRGRGPVRVLLSDRPTAAPAADPPTSLSWPLSLQSLAAPVRCRVAHTSDTTSTSLFDQRVIDVRAIWRDYVGEGRPESAGNVSHSNRGATVSGHANTTDQRGHLPKEINICPKKDDVAMLAVISLGYDSPQTLAAN
jgi:hypothetical protein